MDGSFLTCGNGEWMGWALPQGADRAKRFYEKLCKYEYKLVSENYLISTALKSVSTVIKMLTLF